MPPTLYVTKPVKVVETPNLTINEFFGNVASKDATTSFALVEVAAADEAGFQTPAFAEYVICNTGSIEFTHSDGEIVRAVAGDGVHLPAGLRVKWRFPEPCTYAVVCLPAYSPEMNAVEEGGTIVDDAAREKLRAIHHEVGSDAVRSVGDVAAATALARAVVVPPVAVVDAPGITITEHFGRVASGDAAASLGKAVVAAASEEAWQAPGFDEFVICAEGAIDFEHGDGQTASIRAGEGVFLPKGLRVKWRWLQPTRYFVLCLPAFSPALSGREAEAGATVAKDSASMRRLEQLHEQTAVAS